MFLDRFSHQTMKKAFKEKKDLAQYFIRGCLSARQGLKKMGILRSERSLQGDYAEWLIEEMLCLNLTPTTIQKGYDAKDKYGRTYQIKSRLVKTLNSNTSFDFREIEAKFNFLICVFFSPTFELLGVVRVPYKVVKELRRENEQRFSFRWNRKIAGDRRIKKIFWKEDAA